MKYLATLFFSILCAQVGMTQDFAPIGTAWHWGSTNPWQPNNQDFISYQADRDTVILGKNCTVITKNNDYACLYRPDMEFLYEQNDTVFYYEPALEDFQILYNFMAETGDSWMIRVPDYDFDLNVIDWDTVTILVDSIGVVDMNGMSLKKQFVTIHENYDSQEDNSFTATILERMGYQHFLFPFITENHSMDCGGVSFRCYEDPDFGFFGNVGGDSCEQIIIGTEDIEKATNDLTIQPNPSGGILSIDSDNQAIFAYRILDLYGRQVLSGRATVGEEINVQHLDSGLYLVELMQSNKELVYKMLVRN